jgi:hypothetical protein
MTAFAAEEEHVTAERICGVPHIRFYVSRENMWRRGSAACNSAVMLAFAAT